MPLQDSSALNQNASTEPIAELVGSRNSETADSRTLNSLDSKSSNRPYFHADNFRLLEVESSKSNDCQDQSATGLNEARGKATELCVSATLETAHTDDGALLRDTQVVDSDNTSELKLTNSTKQKESENSSEMLSSETPASKLESIKKPSRSRPKTHPAVRAIDATKLLQLVDLDNTSDLADSAKQKEC